MHQVSESWHVACGSLRVANGVNNYRLKFCGVYVYLSWLEQDSSVVR